uniref:Uncharacterized protein n=1 Tax=Timema tahoe TaxID=61484 RepID=A0A7R9FI11_9NEOP|nr:unnamed protein product [Timema tahoe]
MYVHECPLSLSSFVEFLMYDLNSFRDEKEVDWELLPCTTISLPEWIGYRYLALRIPSQSGLGTAPLHHDFSPRVDWVPQPCTTNSLPEWIGNCYLASTTNSPDKLDWVLLYCTTISLPRWIGYCYLGLSMRHRQLNQRQRARLYLEIGLYIRGKITILKPHRVNLVLSGLQVKGFKTQPGVLRFFLSPSRLDLEEVYQHLRGGKVENYQEISPSVQPTEILTPMSLSSAI